MPKHIGETSLTKVFELIEEKVNTLKKLIDGKAEKNHSHSYNDLTDKPSSLPSIGGEISTQVQADFEQGDKTKVDYIKNRPFYTEDEYKHTVVWKDESIDYSNYKVGDIIPRKDGLNELSFYMHWVNVMETSIKVTDAVTVETGYGEDARMSGVLTSTGSISQVLFVYSDIIDEAGSVSIPAGIYINDVLDSINGSIIDPSAVTAEFTYTFHKQVDKKYLPETPFTIVLDMENINEDIPITSMDDVFKMYFSLYSSADIKVFFRFINGENYLYLPGRSLGLGYVEVTFFFTTYIYGANMETMSLQLVGKRPLIPETSSEQTATTYGLRNPSLSDQITASLEERGLTHERFKELFPKADFTKFIQK